ncbi:MAG TPA: LuxR C-terminal-related transcriptional regulator [Tepidisphaeraceae bacterium]|nr:LuxR C-terminal-related transcriptional regulator [Tepidisphaeraceae bacterium]
MDLSLDDVSAVVRLVREVCDRWDDPSGWREHLLRGACALMNANVGMMLTEHHGKMYHFGRLSVTSVVGLPEPKRLLVQPGVEQMQNRDYQDVSENFLPGLTTLYDDFVKQGWVTVPRSQMADDQTYHAAPHYRDFRKQLDCDDYVVSIRMVDLPRRPEGITIDRPHGAEKFGIREVALLKLIHDEIAPLVGVRLATEEHLCRDGLSKRLRETLELLLEGMSEKEVARELELSAKTVHEYVGMIYKHFQVSSRGELLAYFIRREPVLRRRRVDLKTNVTG